MDINPRGMFQIHVLRPRDGGHDEGAKGALHVCRPLRRRALRLRDMRPILHHSQEELPTGRDSYVNSDLELCLHALYFLLMICSCIVCLLSGPRRAKLLDWRSLNRRSRLPNPDFRLKDCLSVIAPRLGIGLCLHFLAFDRIFNL